MRVLDCSLSLLVVAAKGASVRCARLVGEEVDDSPESVLQP